MQKRDYLSHSFSSRSILHSQSQLQTFARFYSKEEKNGAKFTHLDEKTNQPAMVDVSPKKETFRTAHAQTIVKLPIEIVSHFVSGDISTPKGPVFSTAIVAGTMAVKKTSELIPFCHPLNIEKCKITIELDEKSGILKIDSIVGISGKTGVEMEALTGATVTALAVYDMCKSITHNIVIAETKLISKTGGKSDIK